MRFLLLFAHGSSTDIETNVDSLGIKSVLVAFLVLAVLLVIASRTNKKVKRNTLKKTLFFLVSVTVIVPTLLLSGSSIYLNTISDSRGPVHWKTDVEFWVCNQEIELRNPSGLLNSRVGIASFHEHDDKTIYLDGPVVDIEHDASLKKFLKVTGGEITSDYMVIPTEEGIFENDKDGDENTGNQVLVAGFVSKDNNDEKILSVKNGDSCLSQGGYGEIQAFLYKFNESAGTYTQKKIDQPELFTLNEESVGDPGQCLIVEFDIVKNRTEKLCKSFGEIDFEKCEAFGVDKFNPKVCRIHELKYTTEQPFVDEEAL